MSRHKQGSAIPTSLALAAWALIAILVLTSGWMLASGEELQSTAAAIISLPSQNGHIIAAALWTGVYAMLLRLRRATSSCLHCYHHDDHLHKRTRTRVCTHEQTTRYPCAGLQASTYPHFSMHAQCNPATLLLVGLVTTAGCGWAETVALGELSGTDAAVIFATEPLWGVLWARVTIDERLEASTYLGGFLLIVATIISGYEYTAGGGGGEPTPMHISARELAG